jgi:hypothetical protein
MARKKKDLVKVVGWYTQVTGETQIDSHKVSDWLLARGYEPPKPREPRDILAHEISRALGAEHRRSTETGRSYRAFHAFATKTASGEQLTFWVDIEDATRKQMHISLNQRREQAVGEAVQMTVDANEWSRRNPDQLPLQVQLDFGPDVEWELNAPPEADKKAG